MARQMLAFRRNQPTAPTTLNTYVRGFGWEHQTIFGAVAITGLTVDTGTVKETVTLKAEYILISDGTGLIGLTLNKGAAGSLYLWAEISGNIYASGAIVITSA